MLVPLDRFAEFSRAIDPLHLRGVLNFQGAPYQQAGPFHADPDTVAGKLLYKDSPVRGVGPAATSATRPATPPASRAPPSSTAPGTASPAPVRPAAAPAAATAASNRSDIIGFSSADAIAEIDRRLGEIKTAIEQRGRQAC